MLTYTLNVGLLLPSSSLYLGSAGIEDTPSTGLPTQTQTLTINGGSCYVQVMCMLVVLHSCTCMQDCYYQTLDLVWVLIPLYCNLHQHQLWMVCIIMFTYCYCCLFILCVLVHMHSCRTANTIKQLGSHLQLNTGSMLQPTPTMSGIYYSLVAMSFSSLNLVSPAHACRTATIKQPRLWIWFEYWYHTAAHTSTNYAWYITCVYLCIFIVWI